MDRHATLFSVPVQQEHQQLILPVVITLFIRSNKHAKHVFYCVTGLLSLSTHLRASNCVDCYYTALRSLFALLEGSYIDTEGVF